MFFTILFVTQWADAPIIDCESSAAYIDDFGVFLRCEVRARPPLTSIYWLIDDNDTVVMDGEYVGDYWSIDMVSINRKLAYNQSVSEPVAESVLVFRVGSWEMIFRARRVCKCCFIR